VNETLIDKNYISLPISSSYNKGIGWRCWSTLYKERREHKLWEIRKLWKYL